MYRYFLQQHIVKLTAKLIFVHTRGIVAYPEDLSPSSSSVILLAKAWRYPLASFSSLTLQEENDIFTTKFIPKQSSESKWALYDKTFVMSIQDGGPPKVLPAGYSAGLHQNEVDTLFVPIV